MTSYIQEWNDLFKDQATQEKNMVQIDLYYKLEEAAYKTILQDPTKTWQGSAGDLAAGLGFKDNLVIFAGFLEGLNPSLKSQIDLEAMTDETNIKLDIDFDQLFLAMHDAKADWLYGIKAWDQVISPERQQSMLYEWRQSKQARVEKIGRNDPCPCGSGKKYKKCCGKNI